MPLCPAGCGRTIPASKYLCNIDGDRAGQLAVGMGLAFDAGNALQLAQLVAQLGLGTLTGGAARG